MSVRNIAITPQKNKAQHRFRSVTNSSWERRTGLRILCLYFMGLNLSNAQIAQELGMNPNDIQWMTKPLQDGIVNRQPEPILSGTVECDEMHMVAGHI